MVYGGLLLCLRFRMLSSFPPLWRSLSALKKYRSDRISRSRHCFTPFLVPNWSMFNYLSFAHTCRARGSQHRQLFGQRRFWPPKKYRLGCWNHPNDTRHLWWAPALWCGHISRSRRCFAPFLVPNWSMFQYLSFVYTFRASGYQHRHLL